MAPTLRLLTLARRDCTYFRALLRQRLAHHSTSASARRCCSSGGNERTGVPAGPAVAALVARPQLPNSPLASGLAWLDVNAGGTGETALLA